jgi:HAD superfamily hydrolase (TIGR01450 family)
VTWLLDLDGVVWLARRPIPGAAAAIAHLRQAGERVVFFTNNSGPTVDDHVGHLASVGIPAERGDVLTSGQAAASLLDAGTTAAVVGGQGIVEALTERGVHIVPAADHPEALVVGRTTDLSYAALSSAASAIRDSSRFLATNTDATYPTPGGPVPGAGAIVAFLQVAAGVPPTVAGKPAAAAARLVADRIGPIAVSVGDRVDTDGLFAAATGSRFALVLSGVTSPSDLPVAPAPDIVGDDLAAVVRHELGEGER